MTYSRGVSLNTPGISFRKERGRIVDEFKRFLRQYACQKFLISKDAPVLKVLATAGRELKAAYGDKFLGLALGGSTALGLNHPKSDIDYFVLMDDIRGDRDTHIVEVVGGHLRRSGFIPCDQSLGQVFIRTRPVEGRLPYEFSPKEFDYGLTVGGLCRAIKADNCPIVFATPDNTLERLNEILRTPSFIAAMLPIKVGQDPARFEPLNERRFVKGALKDQAQEFLSFPQDKQKDYVERNRQFLDLVYPQVCPTLAWVKALEAKLPAHSQLLVQLSLGGTPVAGDAELMKQVILKECRNILPAMMAEGRFGWQKKDAILHYRRSLGLDSDYVVKRFLRSCCGQVATEDALAGLRQDQQFKAELERLAKPYLAKREKRFPFPQAISDIFTAISNS